jgi:hypothetical protein
MSAHGALIILPQTSCCMVLCDNKKIRNVSGTFLLARAVLAVVDKDMIALGLLPPETESEASAC